jgi:hypothetical protein
MQGGGEKKVLLPGTAAMLIGSKSRANPSDLRIHPFSNKTDGTDLY